MAKSSSSKTSSVPKALYRRYRPTRLSDVVGQDQVTTVLENAIKTHSFGHAYLFIGPRGTGKTSVARIFAHEVNGFDYQLEDSYLDIIEIDAASNTGVDNIRDLREKAVIAPTTGKYKVYIIDEVHMLTKSAANALLKTLEEPPEHVIFILATTDAHKVPITISSRTQVQTFKLASPETMLEHLQTIVKQEKIPITDDALEIVAQRGGGSFRDTLSLLDQVRNLSSEQITAEILTSALGLPQSESIKRLIDAYIANDFAAISALLKDLLNSGIKPEIIASEAINNIVAHPRTETLPLLAKLPDVNAPFGEAKLLVSFLNVQGSHQNTHVPRSNLATSSAEQSPAPTAVNSRKHNVAVAPEIEPQNAAPASPNPETNQSPSTNTISAKNFSWEDFIEAIHAQSSVLYNQLQKVTYNLEGGTLHLYPAQKFSKNILEKPNNRQLLTSVLSDLSLVVHEAGENPGVKDEKLSQISAIMGNIQEIKGDQPF